MWRLLYIPGGFLALLALVLGILFIRERSYCTVSTEEHVLIPHSNWSVDQRFADCGGLDRGFTEVVATERATKRSVVLVRLSSTNVHLRLIPPDEIAISLPNRSDIAEMNNAFGRYRVRFDFTPRDDPVDRANYRHWLHNFDSPEAIAWCRQNMPRVSCGRVGGN